MPPKVESPGVLALASRFESFGLAASKSLELARQKQNAILFQDFLAAQNLAATSTALPKSEASLLLHLALTGSSLSAEKQAVIKDAVLDGRLLSNDQVTGVPRFVSITVRRLIGFVLRAEAIKYCAANDSINTSDFNAAAGVGEWCKHFAE